jgi:hypothetical protein
MTGAAALAVVDNHLAHLSPARAALAEHLQKIAHAHAALLPVTRLHGQVRLAIDRLAGAESDLAAANAAHARSFQDGGTIEQKTPPNVGDAEAAVATASRTLAAVRQALAQAEAEPAAKAAALELQRAPAETDALAIAVLRE